MEGISKLKELEDKQKLLNDKSFIKSMKKNYTAKNQYWWSII